VSESSQSPESSPAPSESSLGRKPVRGSGAARDQVSGSSGRKQRRRLAPSEKYEVFVQVLTQQATQREAAEQWGVDRSTVIGICRTAKQGALKTPYVTSWGTGARRRTAWTWGVRIPGSLTRRGRGLRACRPSAAAGHRAGQRLPPVGARPG
jgi:hypothetical protein